MLLIVGKDAVGGKHHPNYWYPIANSNHMRDYNKNK